MLVIPRPNQREMLSLSRTELSTPLDKSKDIWGDVIVYKSKYILYLGWINNQRCHNTAQVLLVVSRTEVERKNMWVALGFDSVSVILFRTFVLSLLNATNWAMLISKVNGMYNLPQLVKNILRGVWLKTILSPTKFYLHSTVHNLIKQ